MPVQTAESQAKMSPSEAINLLIEGNERFLNGAMKERDLMS